MQTAIVTTTDVGKWTVVIWLHTATDPLPDEWEIGVTATVEARRKGRGDLFLRSLVVSDGGAPNAAQRKQLTNEVFGGKPNKLAVITNSLDNPIKRGVATAISWLNPAFKAVPVDKWRDAFRHLDLQDHVSALLAELHELQKGLPHVKALAELTQAVEAASSQPSR